VKDTRVFLEYSQADLDRAYDQQAWAPNRSEVLDRQASASESTRSALAHTSGIPYGPADDETLDVFPGRAGGPVHVFVHGGAWRGRYRRETHFVARPFVEAGATFVALGFAIIPEVRLPEMVDQLRRALAWVYRNVARFGADPERVHLSGHSSGAHLAAVLLTTDWQATFGLPENVVKSGLCVSGLYDLRPVMLSARGEYLRLSADEEDALSPQRHTGRIRGPVTVAYGERESPEFQRQARDFAATLDASRRPSRLLRIDALNHFEVLDALGQANGLLARAVLAQMGLG
jgi:arylformamidase